jgi:catechol 2,3-dioxygenase-like lactoylglutathione lyase family enzyme
VAKTFGICGIHHVTQVVKDLAVAKEFYGGTLGLATLDRPDYDFEGAWFGCGQIEFHLIVSEEHPGPSRRHLAIEVDDFDACISSVRTAGVGIVGGPGVRPHNGRSFFFCKDPSGNLIEMSGPPS